MSLPGPNVKDRFLGALLGMAIGDALGIASNGLTRVEIRTRLGRVEGYLPQVDSSGNVLEPAGQFSENTELAICLAESLITSNGFVDPATAGYRFVQVLQGPHAHFLGTTTRRALELAEQSGDFQDGVGGAHSAGASPAGRVIPIALVHALADLNNEVFVREVLRSTLITHAHPASVNGALASAYALRLAIRREIPPEFTIDEVLSFIDEDEVAARLRVARQLAERGNQSLAADLDVIGTSGYIPEAVSAALYIYACIGQDFEAAVLAAANQGGASSTVGAIVGALSGAWLGARALPLQLVEGLDGRMYLLMAAPALLRVAQQRAGLFLHLQQL
jgi:ADP-ribosylglycohydrolase